MKGMRIVLLVAMVLLIAAASAAAAPAASIPIEPNILEEEPNDDPDTANYADWGEARHGVIGAAGDVDFYRFYTGKFDTFAIDFYKPESSPLSAVLGIYDWEGNLLKESTCVDNGPCLYFVSSDYDDKFLKVSDAAAAGGPTYEYRITIRYMDKHEDPNEPNDFLSEATPIAYDDYVESMFDPCGDIDYYTFTGQAGDFVRIDKSWWYVIDLMDADGNILVSFGIDEYDYEGTILPQTGTYYLYFHDPYWCGEEWYSFRVWTPDQPVYVSFSTAGTIQGIPFTSGDVLRYWMRAGTWEMFIDMSDLGLKGNLTALGEKITWCDETEGFLFGFAAKYTHTDLGTVQPQDLVRFYPESTGPDTTGYLELWVDGSDIGLKTTDERIDAVGLNCWYNIFMSTTGQARIPYGYFGLAQATFRDEDVISNDGQWYGRFDGSAHKLGTSDVVGIDVGGNLMLSFDRTVKLSGITFAPGDIAECYGGGYWWDDTCDYFTKFFDASDAGVGSYRIDAFEVGDEQ